MKTYLVKNSAAPFGYSLEVIDDNGNVSTLEITGNDPKNPKVLHLPENPSNRQWITPKGEERQELQFKATRTLTPRTSEAQPKMSKSSKGWEEFLTDEEKEIIEKLKSKALKRKEVADLRKAIEAQNELLAKLEADEEGE